MNEISDQELIVKYLAGNEKLLDVLVQRYFKAIYNYICRLANNPIEAEDLTQEVFVKIWKNLSRYKQEMNFKSWIFSIAKNTTIDHLRKKKDVPLSYFDDDSGGNLIEDTIKDTELLPDELFARHDLAAKLDQVLSKLTLAEKNVVILHYQEEMTFKEISEAVGEPIDTVKSRYRRSLIKLRDLLINN